MKDKCCKNCDFINGNHCEKYDYDLEWNINIDSCEGFESIPPKKDKLKSACKDCYFFHNNDCYRYPPRASSLGEMMRTPVAPDNWCGEFEERNEE